MTGPSRPEGPPRTTIVLVNYNTAGLTCRCLASISSHCGGPSCEVIVVDNASGDDSCSRITREFPWVTLIANKSNAGFGPACNTGAAAARGGYLFFLNTDTELCENSPAVLADFLDSRPEIAAAGCALVGPDGRAQPSAGHFPSLLRVAAGREALAAGLGRVWPALARRLRLYLPPGESTEPVPVDWCLGAALMVRRASFDAVGGFDPLMFLYGEEMELCYRLARAGGDVYFVPQTAIMHLEAASSGGTASPARMACVAAGQRYFYRKHKSFPCYLLFCAVELGASAAKLCFWQAASLVCGSGPKARCRDRAMWHRLYLRCYFRRSYGQA